MDPIAAILAVVVKERPRAEVLADLRGWYARRGFHPSLADIHARARTQGAHLGQGMALPRNWRHSARCLGAIDP